MGKIIVYANNKSEVLASKVQDYIFDSVADNTKRGYTSDFKKFSAWCSASGLVSLPADPQTLALYFTYMAESGLKASTIERSRAAISMAHELKGLVCPVFDRKVKQTLKGIRRKIGTAKNKKAPVLSRDIKAMLSALPEGLIGIRDKAILLIGFAGAFRRSELIDISIEHIEVTAEGLKILIPKSKTDQEGAGRLVAIKRGRNAVTCPVRAYLDWIAAAAITSGQVFRSIDRHTNIKLPITSQSIALIVKRAAVAAGLDSTKYSGHSLRAGFVTQGALNGASESNIMRQTGHKSHDTVRGYIRIANVFKNNVSGMLGL